MLDEIGQTEFLFTKSFLSSLFGVPVQAGSLNFYSIENERAVFKKRKNTNLDLMLRFNLPTASSEQLNLVLGTLIYWAEITKTVRRMFNLHTGVFVKSSRRLSRVDVTMINPNFIVSFLNEALGYRASDLTSLNKNLIVRLT